ncbi:MAG: tetratricopeptide repeat protein [Alphaproteobacteria bacterium]|nr:tetratricopeptide repeat protein [Alphaproteobacteria bacterium]
MAAQASALERSKRIEDALDAYTVLSRLDRTNALAWEGRGRCLIELGRNSEALAALERALTVEPELEWGHYNIGWLLHIKLGDPERAIGHFQRAIERLPHHALPVAGKAYSLVMVGSPHEALEVLREALEDPELDDAFELHTALGAAHYHGGEPEKALAAYEKAKEEAGEGHPGIELSIIEILIQLDRREAAQSRLADMAEDDHAPGRGVGAPASGEVRG